MYTIYSLYKRHKSYDIITVTAATGWIEFDAKVNCGELKHYPPPT